jgi:hypothetical protein
MDETALKKYYKKNSFKKKSTANRIPLPVRSWRAHPERIHF